MIDDNYIACLQKLSLTHTHRRRIKFSIQLISGIHHRQKYFNTLSQFFYLWTIQICGQFKSREKGIRYDNGCYTMTALYSMNHSFLINLKKKHDNK